ncbi:hypothetical protein ACFWXA_13340 [Streptomyces atroolivaceus]|uniref:hypothetical protein n=1 Tax=Streptomyces atroolivaceus TaxID=66869 RepID=UPI0036649479
MIDTRVCIDDMLGPFDCKLDPTNRWNGWLSPYFALDAARKLSAQTLTMADEYGYDCTDTIHVIDGRTDSPDTVHVIEGGTDSEHRPQGVTVRIRWSQLDQDADEAVSITPRIDGEPTAGEPGQDGKGEARAVVLHIRWQWLHEDSDTAATMTRPNRDGLYGIGGWEWTWHFASWWCVCGEGIDWHEMECDGCGMSREKALLLGETARKVGEVLHRLAPGATAVLLDSMDGVPHIAAVFAGDTELSTGDDGPFDTETLGEADAVLRAELDGSQKAGGLLRFPTDND